MARLKGTLEFTGSLGNVSAYTMRGSDKIILRSKVGVSKEKIKTSKNFARTRELNQEWIGCTKAGKGIGQSIRLIKHLADYNITGSLNAIAKAIQKCDTKNLPGKRSIQFSKYREYFEGFQLNKQTLLDSVVRRPLTFSLNRATASAVIHFPSLNPKLNFKNRNQRPLFRFCAVLGVVSDVEYSGDIMIYRPLNGKVHGYCCLYESAWFSAFAPFDGITAELRIDPELALGETESLVLGAGIEFGNPLPNGVEAIKYSGSGKILVTG